MLAIKDFKWYMLIGCPACGDHPLGTPDYYPSDPFVCVMCQSVYPQGFDLTQQEKDTMQSQSEATRKEMFDE